MQHYTTKHQANERQTYTNCCLGLKDSDLRVFSFRNFVRVSSRGDELQTSAPLIFSHLFRISAMVVQQLVAESVPRIPRPTEGGIGWKWVVVPDHTLSRAGNLTFFN